MDAVVLNLSRKWRSQDFDQVIGQDLAVRILKNSLYLGHYFPVYLFAGQRGCGKTSTARIFAAAVNCNALTSFQKDPKKSAIPCLVCESCIAMRDGSHPDFIEIDAASHTGVDNVRSIIESSSLLPVMGRKRVYLIDEAHMLSKAAFNAALKILEEPPATALFILATTNPHKIIDTVRSRCFQLFFSPIAHLPLKNHLQMICKCEKIAHTDEALDLIVRHTQGSARDALNLLEQVRFSTAVVNKQAVVLLLGHVEDQQVINLIRLTLQGASADLVHALESLTLNAHKAEFVWERMVVLLRALLWIKHGVRPHEIVASVKMLEEHARTLSEGEVHRMIEALYANEELFLKTSLQAIFLEMILLDLCSKDKKKSDNGSSSAAPLSIGAIAYDADGVVTESEDGVEEIKQEGVISDDQKWQQFVTQTGSLNDPLIHSLFKQARFVAYATENHTVTIELSKDFILFKDRFEQSKAVWQPLLHEAFGAQVTVEMQFTGMHRTEVIRKPKSAEAPVAPQSSPQIKPATPPAYRQQQEQFRGGATRYYNNAQKAPVAANKNDLRIDVSDATIWKKSALLLRHFPGTITEIQPKQ